jgi:uncharacterized membrane protein
MVGETATLAAIVGMALVTYATRAGGILIMRFVPLTARTEAFLRHLSSSVLVAMVAPPLVAGDLAAPVAVSATLLAMLATRNIVAAMVAGVAGAALLRWALAA